MALKATIFKADLQISDMNRHYYHTHSLTVAQHPSETDERVMVRLLAFACHADEALTFTKGIAEADEPDLWHKDLTGVIKLWIEIGQPDERRILKACGRSEQVVIYTYSSHSDIWWKQLSSKLARVKNLTVMNLPERLSKQLAALAQRSMQLQCTIQEEQIWFSNGNETLQIEFETLQMPANKN
ncbi:MAG: YaeQ family protein [Pseudomonadota bacterium]